MSRILKNSMIFAIGLAAVCVVTLACGMDPKTPMMETGNGGNATEQPRVTPDVPVPVSEAEYDQELYPNTVNVFADFSTSRGDFRAILYDDLVPSIVDNFVSLAEDGFYDGLTFHRVVENFVIQGGDPAGNGSGGPGYQIDDEFHPAALHDRAGVLSMANSGPNTNGSQFFVTLGPTPHLDAYNADGSPKNCVQGVSCHAVFGRLVTGLAEVASRVQMGDVINRIVIHRETTTIIPSATSDGQALTTVESSMLEDDKTYYAGFETDAGNFRIEIKHREVPTIATYFAERVLDGYYNGTTIGPLPIDGYPEVLLGGFVAGDNNAVPVFLTDQGLAQNVAESQYHPDVSHDIAGAISLFPLTDPMFSSAYLQITTSPTPEINAYDTDGELREDCAEPIPCAAAFGTVIEGLSILQELSASSTPTLIHRVVLQSS